MLVPTGALIFLVPNVLGSWHHGDALADVAFWLFLGLTLVTPVVNGLTNRCGPGLRRFGAWSAAGLAAVATSFLVFAATRFLEVNLEVRGPSWEELVSSAIVFAVVAAMAWVCARDAHRGLAHLDGPEWIDALGALFSALGTVVLAGLACGMGST